MMPDQNARNLLATAYLVEATGCERHFLWCENAIAARAVDRRDGPRGSRLTPPLRYGDPAHMVAVLPLGSRPFCWARRPERDLGGYRWAKPPKRANAVFAPRKLRSAGAP